MPEKLHYGYKPYEDNPWNDHVLRRMVVDKYTFCRHIDQENRLVYDIAAPKRLSV